MATRDQASRDKAYKRYVDSGYTDESARIGMGHSTTEKTSNGTREYSGDGKTYSTYDSSGRQSGSGFTGTENWGKDGGSGGGTIGGYLADNIKDASNKRGSSRSKSTPSVMQQQSFNVDDLLKNLQAQWDTQLQTQQQGQLQAQQAQQAITNANAVKLANTNLYNQSNQGILNGTAQGMSSGVNTTQQSVLQTPSTQIGTRNPNLVSTGQGAGVKQNQLNAQSKYITDMWANK